MEFDELRKRIKEKFGTISSFCRSSGEDDYELQKLFAGERANPNGNPERTKKMIALSVLVKDSSPNNDVAKITPELRAKIDKAITDRGGVLKFSSNTQFSKVSLFQILDGRRKRRTALVNDLVKFLGIDE